MNEAKFQKLKEASWRRKLTAEEQAALNSYLDERFSWEEEAALNQLLGKLPDAPVSTNFTARVLQAVERDAVVAPRGEEPGWFHWVRFNWLPRVAVVGLFVCVGFFSVQEYYTAQRTEIARTEIARDVATVSSVATFPQKWLQDFDAINRLSQPPVDDELLAALQ